MIFQELLQNLLDDTGRSLRLFGPELTLCATIIAMLLLRVLSWSRRSDAFFKWATSWLPLVGALVALYLAAPWTYLGGAGLEKEEIFTGMLIYDELTVYFRAFLVFFAAAFVVFTRLSGIPDSEDAADFYTLLLGGTLGMCLMASANHLLMVFLAVEMASVPSYALAGILKGRRKASEAALKYAVFGAGTAGIMLYGISLLAGVLGTVHLPTMAVRLAEMLSAGTGTDTYMALVLGGLMVTVGLSFKLSAVPFHFWCPDVFEGAAAEVDAFLSVASKGAALALLVRLALGVSYVPEPAPVDAVAAVEAAATVQTASTEQNATFQQASHHARAALVAQEEQADLTTALAPVRLFVYRVLALLAVITCTFGNLAAYGQTNIKRLLAYSTIAHAGYMIMPVAAAVALVGGDAASNNLAREAIAALAFYVGAYLFMNLGAFAVVAFLRNATGSEEIADYAGLVNRSPVMAVSMTILLLSLLGMPPLAGFVAKFAIFKALVSADLWMLLAVAGLNTVLSLFYYVRVIKVMTLEPEPEGRPSTEFSLPWSAVAYTFAITLPVVGLGIWNNRFVEWTLAAARQLLS